MGVFDGIGQKFLVVKTEDVKYLDESEQFQFKQLLQKIDQCRFSLGKNINVYMVVNIDEPYAPEVAVILKDHGHLGPSTPNDPNQIQAILDGDVLTLPVYEMGD